MKRNSIKIGAHISTAGGLYRCFERAANISAGVIQIFGSSPRQWQARQPSTGELKKYHEARQAFSKPLVFLHAAYLVNPASQNPEIYKKSIKSLIDHLRITTALKAEGLIFHLGSSKGGDKNNSLKTIAKATQTALDAVPGNAKMIMENSSGGGNKIGSTLEELRQLSLLCKTPRVGFCFDTAHAFGAGLLDYANARQIKVFFDKWEKEIGLDRLQAIHANDSKAQFNSLRDRHENIGQGEIGIKKFTLLAQEKRLRNIPWILEVPGFLEAGPDKKNIRILQNILN